MERNDRINYMPNHPLFIWNIVSDDRYGSKAKFLGQLELPIDLAYFMFIDDWIKEVLIDTLK